MDVVLWKSLGRVATRVAKDGDSVAVFQDGVE